ncbi:MAG: Abi-alpha family protein [Solirubrobacteraceae bacterium]
MTGRELERIERPPPNQDSPVEALSGLVRLAAGFWVKGAGWGIGTSMRLARAATDPRLAEQLVREVGDGVRGYAREFLGVAELDERVRQLAPEPISGTDEPGNGAGASSQALRAYGEELLRRSADVELDEETHPAYARILEALAPDEARILRLLATGGDQPAVDVRSGQLLGLNSQVVAEGLNMIGPEAGARYPDRVPSYLNNLYRLGLIWFSKEPIEDPVRYQVLEAQPAVLDAIKGTSRAKSVQRSIGLTPFGRDFCLACLPL